jgi:REP element-mobilizing transposase RayT
VWFGPAIHHRRSIRLKCFDYTKPGAYFVTICTFERQMLLGEIAGDQMRPNEFGAIVNEEWWASEKHRPEISLDAWIVMPNHVHGIVLIKPPDAELATAVTPTRNLKSRITAPNAVPGDRRGTACRAHPLERFGKPVAGSLPTMVRAYKGAVKKRVNEMRQTPGAPVWERGYYERVIRNEKELDRIREYVLANPQRWRFDRENPQRQSDEDDFDLW